MLFVRLVIVFSFLAHPLSTAKSSSLKSVTELLSTLSRVITSVTLESYIKESEATWHLTWEMVGGNDKIRRIGEVDIRTVFDNLDKLSSPLKTFQYTSSFRDDPYNLFGEIADSIDSVTSVTNKTSFASLRSGITTVVKMMNSNIGYLGSEDVEEMIKVLGVLKNTSHENLKTSTVTEAVQTLESIYRQFIVKLQNLLKLSAATIGPLVALSSEEEELNKMQVMVNAMQKYTENFDKLVGMVGELDEMKKSVSTVVSIGSIHSVIRTLGDQLGNVSEVVNEAMKPLDSEKLTSGLPNGLDDLDAMFKDLDSEELRNLISEGKDLNKLKTHLEPLRKFTEDVRRLETSWTPVNDKKSLDTLSGLSEKLKKMANDAEGLSTDTSALQKSIQSVQTCFNGLNNLPATVNFTTIDYLYHSIVKAEKEGKEVLVVLEKITKLKETQGPFSGKDNVFSEVTFQLEFYAQEVLQDMEPEKFLEVVAAVKNVTGLDQLIKDIDYIVKELWPYKNYATDLIELMILLSQTKKSFTIISKSVETNLTKTLTCLESSLDAEQLKNIIKMDSSVGTLKSELNQVSGLDDYLASVKTAQNDIEKVFKRVQKKLRIRRGVNGTNNITEISKNLGKGVNVLQKMSKVFSDKVSMEKVTNSGSEVDVAIQKLPKMSGIWNEATKKEMLQMVKELEELERIAAQVNLTDLLTMQTLFDGATRIRGTQLNTLLFLDPVSFALNSSNNPNLKSAAKDFQIVGNLDLDFTNAHLDLRAASGSLESLQQYFDNLLGIKRVKVSRLKPSRPKPSPVQVTNATQPPSEPPAWLIYVYILIALIVILLVLAVIGYFVWRHYQKDDPLYWHRKYMKKKLAGQFRLFSRYLSFQEEAMFGDKDDKVTRKSLLCAVEKNKLELAEDYLKRGAYVNATRNTETCLHIAVGNTASPEMVELLIRNGADRNALNRQNVTPEGLITLTIELCKKIIATKIKDPKKPKFRIAATLKKYEDDKKEVEKKKKEQASLPMKLESLEKVKKVFEDLKDELFERRVPHLLPVEKFQVFVTPNCDKAKFERSFPGVVTADLSIATHVVVKTNKLGVLELDDDHLANIRMMLMKESWLKACVKRKKNLRDDYKFRVKMISFKGKQYDKVLESHESVHMRKVPILYDVQILYANPDDTKVRGLLESLGATWHLKYPDLSEYNHVNAHPYHFFDKQLFWALFPTADKKSSEDLSNFRQLSLEELMVVLLERKFSYDEKKEPRPPVLAIKKEEKKDDTTEDEDEKDE